MPRKRTGRVATPKPKAPTKSTARPAVKAQARASSSLASTLKTIGSSQKKVADTKRAVAKAAPKPKPSTSGQMAKAKAAPKAAPKKATPAKSTAKPVTKSLASQKKATASTASKINTIKKSQAPKSAPVKFGSGSSKTITKGGKALANVSKEQLNKTGLSLSAYMNKWNKSGSRPS